MTETVRRAGGGASAAGGGASAATVRCVFCPGASVKNHRGSELEGTMMLGSTTHGDVLTRVC